MPKAPAPVLQAAAAPAIILTRASGTVTAPFQHVGKEKSVKFGDVERRSIESNINNVAVPTIGPGGMLGAAPAPGPGILSPGGSGGNGANATSDPSTAGMAKMPAKASPREKFLLAAHKIAKEASPRSPGTSARGGNKRESEEQAQNLPPAKSPREVALEQAAALQQQREAELKRMAQQVDYSREKYRDPADEAPKPKTASGGGVILKPKGGVNNAPFDTIEYDVCNYTACCMTIPLIPFFGYGWFQMAALPWLGWALLLR